MEQRFPNIPLPELEEFIRIVRRLRRECPWDREQTHESIRDMLIEEAYEVVETIDQGNPGALRDELGDLLLHVVMHATIAEQDGSFKLAEVLDRISRKLVHRHPHVFGTRDVKDAQEVKKNWEELKMDEGRTSVLQGVPGSMPALQRALRLQERAAGVGFDWETSDDVWEKIEEELQELKRSLVSESKERREEELGDFLFSIVNYSRFLGINPESALRSTSQKFVDRFQFIEQELRKKGREINDATLEEMEKLWIRAKKRSRVKE